ncbi:MAG TPA: anthranilate phosphoribosyltransferase [Cyanobacteria bacterium UBA8530]|nr:anthranilate phosphoribosyltransferase [Cyanobacteria bacterium UBA8530]
MTYKTIIQKLLDRQDLGRAESEGIMEEIMGGKLTPAQIGSFLAALSAKGETEEEITGFATVMREKCTKVSVDFPVFDTCGTGGSGLPKVNVSTMAAFILAAGGVRVAKHGSRSNTGRSGSMDVLEKMGIRIDLGPRKVEELLESQGLGFMFAPLYHPAMAHVAPVRREIGFRTVFNFLGPLANPAGATRQVLGVSNVSRAPLMIQALKELGSERALVMVGSDGLDEITLTGPTRFWELREGKIFESLFEPESIGLKTVSFEAITGGDPERNAELCATILSGSSEKEFEALRVFTLLNAAAGFWMAEKTPDIGSGYRLAEDLLSSGEAWRKVESYREESQK